MALLHFPINKKFSETYYLHLLFSNNHEHISYLKDC